MERHKCTIEHLLFAAKYLEYTSLAATRGTKALDASSFFKVLSTAPDGEYPWPQEPPEPSPPPQPKRPTPVPVAHSSSEEGKEKRRTSSVSKDSPNEHSGTGTREVHNKLEKNRRAHLKECFEMLKKQLPNMDDRKTSNLSILRNAIRFIQSLKRKEKDSEHEMERLAREKISFQQRLSVLKKEVSIQFDAYMDGNSLALQDDNDETTTTASEGPSLNDLDDMDLPSASAATSDFASSSSSSTTNSVLVGTVPVPSTAAVSLAFTKPMITGAQISVPNKESVASPNHFMAEPRIVQENKATLSVPSPVSVQITSADGGTSTATRVFSTGNLHTMTPIFAAPSGMQLISQPSGIKVITAPNSIMTSNSSVQHISVNHHPHHGQIHVLTPSSNASYASSIVSKSFTDSLVQVASGGAKGIQKPHLVSNLLVSPQTMVELSHNNSGNSNGTNLADIPNSLNLSQNVVKNSVLSGSMAITVKNNLANSMSTSTSSNMITALHVSKPHSQVIQPTLTSSIITQGGSQINNGNHHGVTTNLKPITSNHTVRSLPHIAGIAHVVSQSPISASVGQIVAPGNHMPGVTPLAGPVSVVSHTGAVLQQPLGKVISPVLKQVNSIPMISPQFLQQVSVGSSNQQIVKPVVVVSMPNVVQSGNISSLTPTSLVTMNEQTGVVRGSISQK